LSFAVIEFLFLLQLNYHFQFDLIFFQNCHYYHFYYWCYFYIIYSFILCIILFLYFDLGRQSTEVNCHVQRVGIGYSLSTSTESTGAWLWLCWATFERHWEWWWRQSTSVL